MSPVATLCLIVSFTLIPQISLKSQYIKQMSVSLCVRNKTGAEKLGIGGGLVGPLATTHRLMCICIHEYFFT